MSEFSTSAEVNACLDAFSGWRKDYDDIEEDVAQEAWNAAWLASRDWHAQASAARLAAATAPEGAEQ